MMSLLATSTAFTTMSKVKSLLHADRIYKLMASGLSFKDAAKLDRQSAEFMIEAWEIAMEGCDCDEDDGDGDVITIFYSE